MTGHHAGSRAATRIGGWSLLVAAAGFVVAFSWLAVRFGYPDVLDGAAPQVLPRLIALGSSGRAVWALYAMLPLLLVPAGIGAYAALRSVARDAALGAVVLASLAALTMFFGLARWPSIHWELARAYGAAAPESRVAIDAMFAGLNAYLGNWIGEFIGELALNGFFMLVAVGALRATHIGRWFGLAGLAVGALGIGGAFRNATDVVAPIAEVNNYLLTVWLITLGVVLVRWPAE